MYACPFLFLLASSALQKALPGLRDLTNVVGYRLSAAADGGDPRLHPLIGIVP